MSRSSRLRAQPRRGANPGQKGPGEAAGERTQRPTNGPWAGRSNRQRPGSASLTSLIRCAVGVGCTPGGVAVGGTGSSLGRDEDRAFPWGCLCRIVHQRGADAIYGVGGEVWEECWGTDGRGWPLRGLCAGLRLSALASC